MVSTKQLFGAISTGAMSVLLKNGLTFFLMPIIIQNLSIGAYGLYVLLLSLVEIPKAIGFGFGNGLNRQLTIANETNRKTLAMEYIHCSHWIYAAFVGVLLCTGAGLGNTFTAFFHVQSTDYQHFDWIYWCALIEGSIKLYASRFEAIIESHGEIQWKYLSESIGTLLANCLGIGSVLLGYGLVGLMFCRLGVAAIQTGMLAFKMWQCEPNRYPWWHQLNWTRCVELIKISSHFVVTGFGVIVSHGLDGIVIGHFLSLYWVGTFSFVFRLVAVANRIIATACQILFPMFSRLFAQNNVATSQALFLQSSRWAFYANSAMLLVLALIFPMLFNLMVHKEIRYEDTQVLLWIGIASGVLTAFIYPVIHYLNSHGFARFAMVSSLCTSAGNLLMSLLLVGPWKAIGVALGTLIPQLVEYGGFMIPKTLQSLEIQPIAYLKAVVGNAIVPLTCLALLIYTVMIGVQSLPGLPLWTQLFTHRYTGGYSGSYRWLLACLPKR